MTITTEDIENIFKNYSDVLGDKDIVPDLESELTKIVLERKGLGANSSAMWREANLDDLFELGIKKQLPRQEIKEIFKKCKVEPQALQASTQVSSSFIRTTNNTIKYKTVGRAETITAGNTQGDHSIAEAMIEYGVGRPVDGLEVDKMDNIDELREKRKKLYDFVSAIGILQSDENKRGRYYQAICEKLDHYNEHRQSKGELEALRDILNDIDPQILSATQEKLLEKQDDDKDKLLSHKKKAIRVQGGAIGIIDKMAEERYRENAYLMTQLFTDITSIVLTYYNKIPLTSFERIKGYQASSSEGSEISSAMSRLEDLSKIVSGEKTITVFLEEEEKRIKGKIGRDKAKIKGTRKLAGEETTETVEGVLEEHEKQLRDFQEFVKSNKQFLTSFDYKSDQSDTNFLKQYIFNYLIDAIKDNLYYPAILGNDPKHTAAILKEHQKKANPGSDRLYLVRNNSVKDLETIISRHLFLTLEVFPELRIIEKEITNAFIIKIKEEKVGDQKTVGEHSWGEVDEIENITADSILRKVGELQEQRKTSHFTEYVGARTRASSGQSDEMGDSRRKGDEDRSQNTLDDAANILSSLNKQLRK